MYALSIKKVSQLSLSPPSAASSTKRSWGVSSMMVGASSSRTGLGAAGGDSGTSGCSSLGRGGVQSKISIVPHVCSTVMKRLTTSGRCGAAAPSLFSVSTKCRIPIECGEIGRMSTSFEPVRHCTVL